jgi:hypothetical protein
MALGLPIRLTKNCKSKTYLMPRLACIKACIVRGQVPEKLAYKYGWADAAFLDPGLNAGASSLPLAAALAAGPVLDRLEPHLPLPFITVHHKPDPFFPDGVPIMSKAGHPFIEERLRGENALYGGEMSGRHSFRDSTCCHRGMGPWLPVPEAMRPIGRKFSDLIDAYVISLCSPKLGPTAKAPMGPGVQPRGMDIRHIENLRN